MFLLYQQPDTQKKQIPIIEKIMDTIKNTGPDW